MTRAAQSHKTGARKRTIRKAPHESVSQAIGAVEPGCEVFILTHGQFSLIDALVYLSTQIGPCRLSVSTWTAGAEDLQHMADLLGAGQFTDVRWLVDRSFVSRQPAYCAKLRELFGDDTIRTARLHAKFMTLRNDDFDLAIRTSMNLNHNPRMEDIEISDDRALADFMDTEFNMYFDEQEPGTFNAELFDNTASSGIRTGKATGKRLFAK